MNKLIAILLNLLLVMVVVLLAQLGFILVDSTGALFFDTGTVIKKIHVPAYTTTDVVIYGKMLIPTQHYHPDTWEVGVKTGSYEGCSGVTREVYDRLSVGSSVRLQVSKGRFTDNYHIHEIGLAK